MDWAAIWIIENLKEFIVDKNYLLSLSNSKINIYDTEIVACREREKFFYPVIKENCHGDRNCCQIV